ncbi:integrase arm-type DNA-binding domain-containing protein [Sphingomonadaceae bacterium OTU29THOMA1]|nr:integrase arm-type DNA-binding domain-containing protein [Sphingomonadaceae bacterium OTU29THOMA1]
MLTEKGVLGARPRDKAYKVPDSGGLYLHISPAGTKSWRYKFRAGGKEKLLVIGRHPDVSLKAARLARDEAKRAQASGRDPALEARRVRLVGQGRSEETFEKWARAWHSDQKARWKPVHSADVIESMERDLFPSIGPYPVTDIDEPLLLAALRKVEARGAIETARRLRQRAERVFKYAKAAGTGSGNPASDLKEAMQPLPKRRRWPAIVKITELQVLIRDVDSAGAMPTTRLASRLLALTAQRPGMIAGLPWSEIHNVDWRDPASDSPEALWRIPSDRMKLEFDLREDDEWDHEVPLAPAAVAVLRAIRPLTGSGPLVFCSSRSSHDPLSANAIGYLYNRIGYKGRHVPHGWRSAFSTIMNARAERAQPGADRLIIDRLIIDLMLAHVPSGMSETEFRYNRNRYMERRREIATEWADMLVGDLPTPRDILTSPRRSPAR